MSLHCHGAAAAPSAAASAAMAAMATMAAMPPASLPAVLAQAACDLLPLVEDDLPKAAVASAAVLSAAAAQATADAACRHHAATASVGHLAAAGLFPAKVATPVSPAAAKPDHVVVTTGRRAPTALPLSRGGGPRGATPAKDRRVECGRRCGGGGGRHRVGRYCRRAGRRRLGDIAPRVARCGRRGEVELGATGFLRRAQRRGVCKSTTIVSPPLQCRRPLPYGKHKVCNKQNKNQKAPRTTTKTAPLTPS